jgi:hypothetical protein
VRFWRPIELAMVFPSAKAEENYRKHRANLLYKPFTEIKPRRVWGAQSPIELFLFQELLQRDLSHRKADRRGREGGRRPRFECPRRQGHLSNGCASCR